MYSSPVSFEVTIGPGGIVMSSNHLNVEVPTINLNVFLTNQILNRRAKNHVDVNSWLLFVCLWSMPEPVACGASSGHRVGKFHSWVDYDVMLSSSAKHGAEYSLLVCQIHLGTAELSSFSPSDPPPAPRFRSIAAVCYLQCIDPHCIVWWMYYIQFMPMRRWISPASAMYACRLMSQSLSK